MSDVYVYESAYGDWTIHVASRRRIIQPIPNIIDGNITNKLRIWTKCYLDRTTNNTVYPIKYREAIYKTWLSITLFWHRYIHTTSLHLIPLKEIKLPHAGKTFSEQSALDCATRLKQLREIGYRVPQYVIDDLLEESIEE